MSQIDPAQVRHVAKLARLELTDDEVRLFARQLGDVLDYVRQLEAVDTTGVEPLAQPLTITDVVRVDEPAPSLGADAALANAPERHERGFKVPAVLGDGAPA